MSTRPRECDDCCDEIPRGRRRTRTKCGAMVCSYCLHARTPSTSGVRWPNPPKESHPIGKHRHVWVKAPRDWMCTHIAKGDVAWCSRRAVVGCWACCEGRCSSHCPRKHRPAKKGKP